jgi:hypothetical protein
MAHPTAPGKSESLLREASRHFTKLPSHYTVDLNLLNAGIEAGKILTAAHGPGLLRGRGEAAIEVIPFWLADYPKQTQFIYFTSGLNGNTPMQTEWGPYRRYGASITPVLLRWNFMRRDASRVIPSAQLGGGLLWTTSTLLRRWALDRACLSGKIKA